ncbi:hypothetical protein AVEN_252910-1 [Araneus ventricosus]|uniref:Uncharacterized protein n=1 Tax=Araneus ventricosus TaxID=182803 RepID=A0A4Y2VCL8_ARAVE|nr:hypothetical protein AVEN_252910-1 [Araneus ventricosus]
MWVTLQRRKFLAKKVTLEGIPSSRGYLNKKHHAISTQIRQNEWVIGDSGRKSTSSFQRSRYPHRRGKDKKPCLHRTWPIPNLP